MPFSKLHLTEINEFLISEILKNKGPIEAEIREINADGFIEIDLNSSDKNFDNQIMDFDLQTCECSGLNEHEDISDYIGKTLSTSSVYEFIEFLSTSEESFRLLINIENDSWIIKLLSY